MCITNKSVCVCVCVYVDTLPLADPSSPRVLDELSAYASMNSIWATWLALRDEYLAKPSGPSGLHTLLTSAFDKFSADLLDVARSVDASITALMKTMLSSLKEQHDAVTALRDTISHRESDVNTLQVKLAAVSSELSVKQSELSTSVAELAALKSSFGASKSEIESIRSELSRVSSELSDKSSSLHTTNASVQQLTREVETVAGQLRESEVCVPLSLHFSC